MTNPGRTELPRREHVGVQSVTRAWERTNGPGSTLLSCAEWTTPSQRAGCCRRHDWFDSLVLRRTNDAVAARRLLQDRLSCARQIEPAQRAGAANRLW